MRRKVLALLVICLAVALARALAADGFLGARVGRVEAGAGVVVE